MKQSVLAVLLAVLLISVSAHADRGDQYLIAKLGAMQIQKNSADALFSVGAYYGYGITSDITAEAEVNIGLTGGEYGAGQDAGSYDVWTLAGYGVYRLPISGNAYVKGKLGFLYENVTNDMFTVTYTTNDYGIAGGAGIGMTLPNKLTLEGEATLIDQDIIFWSVGVHYPF